MQYLNLNLSDLDSAEFKGSEPVDRATWLCLLRYCAGQENGGTIKGCFGWKDRQWQQVCGVTLEEVQRGCELWSWKGENLEVRFYPTGLEAEIRAKRKGAKSTNRKRWTASVVAPPKVSPSLSESLSESQVSKVSNVIEVSKEVMEAEPPALPPPSDGVPTLDEVLTFASMHGVPDASARRFFDYHEGKNLWFNKHNRLIHWRHEIVSWAARDRQQTTANEVHKAEKVAENLDAEAIVGNMVKKFRAAQQSNHQAA